MLSVLIPTYNYNILPLVTEIHRQCNECGIEFEIISLDDGSKSSLNDVNQSINSIPNSSFKELTQNIGRSSIRNLLAQKANYNWLLFLDADTMPEDTFFIKKYIQEISNEEKVVYGGICYQEEKPRKDEILRWIYGKAREALDTETRNKAPYISMLTLNFLISKSVFDKVRFNEDIANLRHEDTLFSFNLKQAGIKIEHIKNKIVHHGLENSEIFLSKSLESQKGLLYLIQNGLLPVDYTKMGLLYSKIHKAGLKGFVAFIFRGLQKRMLRNILGSNPSLYIFDFYRLGYLCNLR